MNKLRCIVLMIIGYGGVSTFEQNLDAQKDALAKAGCERIYSDMLSGAKTTRPGLDECLNYVRSGDPLVVWRLDRLGRNLRHLIETVEWLEERGIGFLSLRENIDTTTSGGRLVFYVFGALAEFERDMIRERPQAGLAVARAHGRVGGRPPALDAKKRQVALSLYKDKNLSISDICRTLGVSRTTFYRSLPEIKPRAASPKSPRKQSAAPKQKVGASNASAVPSEGRGKRGEAVSPHLSFPPPSLATQQLTAARLLLKLGSTEWRRHSFEFHEALEA